MSARTLLVIGGTGIISSACVRAAVADGWRVTAVNRGASTDRPLPDAVEVLRADARLPGELARVLGGRSFDVVADFVAYTPDHVREDVALFAGRTGQYVFISSASAYAKPVAHLPIVESTPLRNPYWGYSRDKIACEDLLVEAYRRDAFPVTIVRPSHTYDDAAVPTLGGWTDVVRMRRGDPVPVHGDGTSLWVLTYHTDVAAGVVGLLGRPQAIGEAYHITGDEVLTWDAIYRTLAEAAGVPEPYLVHLASDALARIAPELGPGVLGDRAHSVIFDNAKVRALVPQAGQRVPFVDGARRLVAWHDARGVPGDGALDAVLDRLAAAALA